MLRSIIEHGLKHELVDDLLKILRYIPYDDASLRRRLRHGQPAPGTGTNRSPATLLTALDAKDGRTLFRKRGFGKSNLLAVDAALIILDEQGDVVAGRPTMNGFSALWRQRILRPVAWTVPTVVPPYLLVRDAIQLKAYRFG